MTTLTDLRAQIDALDADLLRLVDARAALGKAIGEAKAREDTATETVSLLRPDREAILIRKLLAMPRSAASDSVVVRVWRELISENLRIQGQARGGLHLNLSAKEHSRETLVWARERFGFAPSFGYVDDAVAAVTAARDVRHISVLSLDPRGGAWWARLLAEKSVRIIAALPEVASARPHAVAMAAIAPEPTGDDITFWVSDSGERETRIIEDLGERGFAADWVCSAQGLKLFSLLGFVQENDARLQGALGSLTGIIGAAPRI
ncbi:chorismate mutase type II family protein [Asticcacaulis biprosthecium C19]|uniref:chorismate mutase n=1 Tax=Asticcacaulis biprosthecium C19 TaxID=715226 RepID=F4QGP4_9CAUL|nr:chorismate mutase [Asticcacaulis biprosthecium]EGF92496.1 chorismate mutase type II family protein [Asticcacaulis biprosthecium C19]